MAEPDFSSGKQVPVDYILKLRQQGMSDHAVIEKLENEGYSSIGIFEALTKADENPGAAPQQGQPQPSTGQQGSAPSQNAPTQDIRNYSMQAQQNTGQQNYSQQPIGESAQPSFDIQESAMQQGNNMQDSDDIANYNGGQNNAGQQPPLDYGPQDNQNPFGGQRQGFNPFARRQQGQHSVRGNTNPAGNQRNAQSQPLQQQNSRGQFQPQNQQSGNQPSNSEQSQVNSSFLQDLENDQAISSLEQRQQPQDPYPNALSYRTVKGDDDSPSFDDTSIDKFDEIAEAIIDEKWKELKGYVEKIVEWKAKVESRIINIEKEMETLESQVTGLQKALMQKVQNYDRHITDVATEIKAMEKVFQKIIPNLTDNVTELSNVVSKMKNSQGGQQNYQGQNFMQQNQQQGFQNGQNGF